MKIKKMDQIESVFKPLRNLMRSFVWTGIAAIICGVPIFIYPDLLGMMAGMFLAVTGVINIAAAAKIGKYAKIKIEI